MRKLIARVIGVFSSMGISLVFALPAFAQSATESAGKGGTSGALPNTGSTEITYVFFIAGVVLFVFGMLKLALSFRE